MKTLRVVLSYTAAAPPHIWFVISAIFHYLGPSFAVLLFQYVGVLGVAWFRIASAAMIFAILTRPWKTFRSANREVLILLWLLGACLALMNSTFYLAIDRLPLSLVAAIEFVGTIAIALFGLRSVHNYIALLLAAIGAFILTGIHWFSDPIGLTYAIINGLLFMSYIVLGHRTARQGAGEGVGRLGAAMAAAFIVVMPIGFSQAVAALPHPTLILAGVGVGICSSVIPYVCDQLAMSRIPRNTFALMLALLPATATLVGAIVLGQIPTLKDAIGISLVMVGVSIHKPALIEG
ncbi:EamA family transporter [Gloeocapsopsis crepidinum LEGE 06123]|uniref:EamA family transporter n=1 Tax=Gloeocapsopsis crepidinum LEGE 06123 TaxID=588587 RepID=A0ABR9UYW0_9CHRO|nr:MULTISPECIES: EamA family transporter [Gloeocapsopsis]MBE9193501.1 EamA family transporter [Gloeocapsopsis crepidinum LEGE 06123]PIG91216.1 EamA family transporter [Gloeocapsopsis sp. IPPAS B-1203]